MKRGTNVIVKDMDKVYLVFLDGNLLHIYTKREWAENFVNSYFKNDERICIEEKEITA